MPQPANGPLAASAEPTWRVGVLFSRSGVMAVSETEHFLGTVLAIEQINAAGGVLGRQIEPVALDPKSDPDEYRRLAEYLLLEEGASVRVRKHRAATRTSTSASWATTRPRCQSRA